MYDLTCMSARRDDSRAEILTKPIVSHTVLLDENAPWPHYDSKKKEEKRKQKEKGKESGFDSQLDS